MESLRTMQVLESEKHHLRSEDQVSKSWKPLMGAAEDTYPEVQISQISNIIPKYILGTISKLFLLYNYSMPYSTVGYMFSVSGADRRWTGK